MSFNDGFNTRSIPYPSNTAVSGNSLVYNGDSWIAAQVSGSGGGGGTGDITAVNAGTNLTGGGTTGDVTLSLSSSVTGLTNLQTTNLTGTHISGSDLKIDYIDFNNLPTKPSFLTGRLYYNADNADLSYDTNVSGVYLNYGQQMAVKVKNTTAASIAKGKLVSISGGVGNNPTIVTASWDNEKLSADTIGMMMNTANVNEFAYVLINGVIEDVNTNGYTGGTTLYLSSSGNYTSTIPVPPKQAVRIGHVVREQTNNGSIFINVQNGYELEELHDVLITSSANGDLLAYDSSVNLWKNTKTLSGSYTATGAITASNFVGTLIGSMSSSLYSREWHVSTGSGNDITGNGSLLNPYRTIGAGIAAASTQGGDQVVIHPGTYVENVTMGKFNTTICAAQGTNGGEINLSGTMTVSQSTAPASSIRIYGIAISNLVHSGVGGLFLDNCKINDSFTKATTAYFRATDCDFNKNISVVSGGFTEFQGGTQSASGSSFTINNSTAFVTIRDSITTYSPVLISGTLGINDCSVLATSSGGSAITSLSPSSVVQIVDSTTVDTNGLPTRISIGGALSYSNSVFNKTTSTLGTALNAISDFEVIRANVITGSVISGSTARFTTITGSNVTGSNAQFTTLTASTVNASNLVTSTNGTIVADRVLIGSGSNIAKATAEMTFYDTGTGYKSLRIADPTDTSFIFIDHAAIDNNGNLDIGVSSTTSIYLGNPSAAVTINGSSVAIDYVPSTPSNWSGTAPTTIGEALDRIAAAVYALGGNTPIP